MVRRWIARELPPPARIRRLAEEGLSVLEGLARRARAKPVSQAVREEDPRAARGLLSFAFGAAVAGLAFAMAAWIRVRLRSPDRLPA